VAGAVFRDIAEIWLNKLKWVRPMTAGRRRPPQDTIFSDILGTTKVQAAINYDMNPCKDITNYASSILMYLTLLRATFHVSTIAAGQCRRTLTNRCRAPQDIT